MLDHLDQKGRPTLLFSPDNRKLADFPISVRNYLRYGEQSGLSERPLVRTRNPWYKMETRIIPPFLFSYLGRRTVRFIRNEAQVLPLSCFLCVFPRLEDAEHIRTLWVILNHPATLRNLRQVGKSYGAGAIKVEPRSLEMLTIPAGLVENTSLYGTNAPQLTLL